MNINSRILLGVIAGIAAGTALGLVLAAEKGSLNKGLNAIRLGNRQRKLKNGSTNSNGTSIQLKNRSATMAYQNFYNDED